MPKDLRDLAGIALILEAVHNIKIGGSCPFSAFSAAAAALLQLTFPARRCCKKRILNLARCFPPVCRTSVAEINDGEVGGVAELASEHPSTSDHDVNLESDAGLTIEELDTSVFEMPPTRASTYDRRDGQ